MTVLEKIHDAFSLVMFSGIIFGMVLIVILSVLDIVLMIVSCLW